MPICNKYTANTNKQTIHIKAIYKKFKFLQLTSSFFILICWVRCGWEEVMKNFIYFWNKKHYSPQFFEGNTGFILFLFFSCIFLVTFVRDFLSIISDIWTMFSLRHHQLHWASIQLRRTRLYNFKIWSLFSVIWEKFVCHINIQYTQIDITWCAVLCDWFYFFFVIPSRPGQN